MRDGDWLTTQKLHRIVKEALAQADPLGLPPGLDDQGRRVALRNALKGLEQGRFVRMKGATKDRKALLVRTPDWLDSMSEAMKAAEPEMERRTRELMCVAERP